MRKLIFILVLFFSTSVFAYELSYICSPGTSANGKGFIKHLLTYDIQEKNDRGNSVEVKTFLNYTNKPLELTAETENGKWELITESYAKLNRSTFDPNFYYFDYVTKYLIEEDEGSASIKQIYYWEITNHKTSYYFTLHELVSLITALDPKGGKADFREDYGSGSCTLIQIH